MSSPTSTPAAVARGDAFCRMFTERIVVLDGAMGTLLQAHKLKEADFRGERFRDHSRNLAGNYDLLCLTRPDLIEKIHAEYYAAGADIAETNTFSSTAIGLAGCGCESLVREINLAAAACARQAADKGQAIDGRQRFVAGAIGPLNRSLSLPPDRTRPDCRVVTWEEVVTAYTGQIEALLDGGVDALMVETIFDARNGEAALFAVEEVFSRRGHAARIPVMLSVTLTPTGHLLSGETIETFYQQVAPARPFSVGINCSFGPDAIRPALEQLSRIAECYVTSHPSAGLPNASGGYDETPAALARALGEFVANGWVNLVGGCCGTAPAHISAIAQAVKGRTPRMTPQAAQALRLTSRGPAALA
ncbi:MAG TPA: homocysteine S-methyltransferase family protein [Opitutaceae bacterium]